MALTDSLFLFDISRDSPCEGTFSVAPRVMCFEGWPTRLVRFPQLVSTIVPVVVPSDGAMTLDDIVDVDHRLFWEWNF